MTVRKKIVVVLTVIFFIVMITFTFVSRQINEKGLTPVKVCAVEADGRIDKNGVVISDEASYIIYPMPRDTMLGQELVAEVEMIEITGEEDGYVYADDDSVYLYVIPTEKDIGEIVPGERLREE